MIQHISSPLRGGAHIATANLIRRLRSRGRQVDVLTNCEIDDDVRVKFGGARFYKWREPRRYGIIWFCNRCFVKLRCACDYPDWTIDPTGGIRRLMMRYDCVCVMSEEDPLRRLVSNLPSNIRKVQMIHTWYSKWCSISNRARRLTKCDRSVYANMDVVAVVGSSNAAEFKELYGGLAQKVCGFKNIIEFVPECRRERRDINGRIRIVTLARFDNTAKMSSRSISIARRLVDEGFDIEWVFAGNGYETAVRQLESEGAMSERIRFVGHVEDPWPLLLSSDIMALFSRFEGLPNSVYDSVRAGLPVACTAVGGMRDQVIDGINGWLFYDDEEEILSGMRRLLSKRAIIEEAKNNLIGYVYDNEAVLSAHMSILGLD